MANDVRPFYINGHEYEGYSDCWFHYEVVMTEEPERSLGDGAMTNIKDIPRYWVPHLWIDYLYMPIEKYRQLKADTVAAEFPVGCIDPNTDQMVYHNMYLAPEERNKLRFYGSKYTGILDLKLEFIGTKNSLNTVNITYNLNGGSGARISNTSVVEMEEFNLPNGRNLTKNGLAFARWSLNADGSGTEYRSGQAVVASSDTTFYAIYV